MVTQVCLDQSSSSAGRRLERVAKPPLGDLAFVVRRRLPAKPRLIAKVRLTSKPRPLAKSRPDKAEG